MAIPARSPSFRRRCWPRKPAFSEPSLITCRLFGRRSSCSSFEHLPNDYCTSRKPGSSSDATTRCRTESSIGNARPTKPFSTRPFRPSLFRLSCLNQMEAAMRKLLVTAIASLALVSGSLLVANRAEAGGSPSAPSKYNNQAASAHQVQTARHEHFAITEYSSSSARNQRH